MHLASSSDSIIQRAAGEIKGFDLKIAGSGESLERLLNYEAHVAGYHVSDERSSRAIHHRLSKNDIQIYPVMKRTQGFIVKKAILCRLNRLRICSIEKSVSLTVKLDPALGFCLILY